MLEASTEVPELDRMSFATGAPTRSRTVQGPPLASLVLLALCAVLSASLVACAGQRSRGATAQTADTATAAPTWTPPPDPHGGSPGPSLIWPTWLNGTIVHQRYVEQTYSATGINPRNGQPITTDQWAEIGADGHPEEMVLQYRGPDGQLIEVRRTTRSDDVEYLDRPPFPVTLPAAQAKSLLAHDGDVRHCSTGVRPSGNALTHLGPVVEFTSPSLFEADGWQASGPFPILAAPTSTPLPGVAPRERYAHPRTPALFHKRVVRGSTIVDQWMAIDPATGRILAGRAEAHVNGALTSSDAITWGAVEVYAPGDVPPSVLTITQKPVCHA